MKNSHNFEAMPLAKVSAISATVRDCVPTNCTFSSLTVVSTFAQGIRSLYKVHGFIKSSKLQITFSTFLMLTNCTPVPIISFSCRSRSLIHLYIPPVNHITAYNFFHFSIFPISIKTCSPQPKHPMFTPFGIIKRSAVNQ